MTTLSLAGEEREVALAEAQSVLAIAGDSGYRDELAFLIAGIEEGEVPAESEETLEQLVELGLQAGRIRALYGPGGEQAALRLYRRLPRGAELGASAREVSKALARARGPGARVGLGPGARPGRVHALAHRRRHGAHRAARPPGRAACERRCLSRSSGTWPASTSRARACLVVGGGTVGAGEGARASSPAAHGSPWSRRRSSPSSERSTSSGCRARYERDDLAGRFLVIAATSDTGVNTRVHQDAERRYLFCNVVGRARALLADPARRASPGADRGGRLDRRRLAGARAADPDADRRGDRARVRRARAAAAGAATVGEAEPADLRGPPRVLRAARRGGAAHDRLARRRGPRRPGADHGAGPRADPRLRRARARPPRLAGARRRGAGGRARDRPRPARPGPGERAPRRLRARRARRRPAQGRRPVRVRARRRGGARTGQGGCGGRGRPGRLVVRGGALRRGDPGHPPRGRLAGDRRRGPRRRLARLRHARRGARYSRLLHGARAAAQDRPPSRRARDRPRDARRRGRRGDAARPADRGRSALGDRRRGGGAAVARARRRR